MTKQKLKSYYWLQHEIRQQKGRLNRLRKKQELSGEIVGDIVNDYKTGKPIPLMIQGIANEDFKLPMIIHLLEAEIEQNIIAAQERVKEIEEFVQTVEDPRMRELLRSRFIDCKRWEDVAASNYISTAHARKLIREYLQNLPQ